MRESAAASLRPFEGERVALPPASNRETLWRLLCLDGVAEAILPLPGEQPPEVRAELARKARCRLPESGGASGAIMETGGVAGDLPPLPPLPGDVPDAVPGTAGPPPPGDRRTEWILTTSGTTGTPKPIPHTFASLTRSTRRDPAVGAGLRWGLLYDVTRFAGLQVFLQALCGGSGLIPTESGGDLDTRVRSLAAADCNALSATPSLWRKLLMLPELHGLRLQRITLGGETADQSILTALSRQFPEARIVHVYASTEAGVGFSVRDRLEGFPESYLEEPQNGVHIRVDPDGALFLRPPSSAETRNAPEPADGSGWIATGDQVRHREDGRYIFLGRANGAINVGGSKVHPDEVERVLLEVGGVRMASVRGRRNSLLGNLVEANVVLDPGFDPEERIAALKAHCKERLHNFQRPAKIRPVDSLELTPAGKVARPEAQ